MRPPHARTKRVRGETGGMGDPVFCDPRSSAVARSERVGKFATQSDSQHSEATLNEADDIISVAQAAPIIGKSVQGTYRAVRAGHIPAGVFFKVGRDLYFRRAQLLAWRDAGGTAQSATEGDATDKARAETMRDLSQLAPGSWPQYFEEKLAGLEERRMKADSRLAAAKAFSEARKPR